ncbi:MAG: class I SAM-dependent methyltransferase [Candidatus Heimdallarchaeota archaeon]
MTNFELDAHIYDLMVDWEKRIKNERPFFQEIFGDIGNKAILDVACGTGKHALEFAQQGHLVTGVDFDQEMVEIAQKHMNSLNQEIQKNLEFQRASFEDLVTDSSIIPGPFDFIVCIGNSLSLLLTKNALTEVLTAFYNRLKQNGQLTIQIVNYQSKSIVTHWTGPLLERSDSLGRKIYFMKLFDRLDADNLKMTVAAIHRFSEDKWTATFAENNLRIFKAVDLEDELGKAGYSDYVIFGDYQRTRFNPEDSSDIVIVAQK